MDPSSLGAQERPRREAGVARCYPKKGRSAGEQLAGRLERGRLSQSLAGCWRKCPSLHHVPNKQLADLRSLTPMFACILGLLLFLLGF